MPLPTLLRKGALVEQDYMNSEEKKTLPNRVAIEFIMEKIDNMLRQPKNGIGDGVLILRSGTGSGKSTTMAPELYIHFHEEFPGGIAITQPRILTTIDIPTQIVNIPSYFMLELEKNIGYSTGAYKRLPHEKGITFMTTGTLSNQITTMASTEFMNKYKFIIIDEVHERDIEIELILILFKNFLMDNWKNPKCPLLILMSATFDPKIFAKYYEVPKTNFIDVVGQTYPIEEHFAEYDVSNYINYTLDVVKKIHEENTEDKVGSSDIIIFIGAEMDGKMILSKLEKYNTSLFLGGKAVIDPILLTKGTYMLGKREYIHIFGAMEQLRVILTIDGKTHAIHPMRRVIVATNIAETGVTIESLRYCIDTGYVLSPNYNPLYDSAILAIKCVTKGMAIQRRGRVGRKSEGVWFPCYTKETFSALQEDDFSRILTEDITFQYLNVFCSSTKARFGECHDGFKRYKYSDKLYCIEHEKLDVSKIDFLESPSADMLQCLVEKLNIYGYLDCNYRITPMGMIANQMRKIGLDDVRFILSGYYYGANILDLITIAAFKKTKKVVKRKYMLKNPIGASDEKEYLFYTRGLIADELIDKIFLLNDYLDVLEKTSKNGKNFEENIQEWCKKNGANIGGIIELISLRDELITSLIQLGIDPFYNGLGLARWSYNLTEIFKGNFQDGIAEIIKLKQCIYEGYKYNLLEWDRERRSYIHKYKRFPVDIMSPVIKPYREGLHKPKFIIAHGLILKKSNRAPKFEFAASNVSVMDGFVDVDANFLYY